MNIEAKNVVSDRRCSSCLELVLVPEQLLTSSSSTVIERAVSQYSKKSRLSGIDIPNDGYSNLV